MNSFLSKFYTIICTFSPLWVIYSFLGDSFTFLDTLIFLFYIVSLPSFIFFKKVRVSPHYAPLFLFVLLHSVICFIMNGDSSIFFRAMHLANYIFFIAYYNKSYFIESFGRKLIRILSISSTFFLFFQHIVFKIWGIPVPGMIPQFALVEASLDNVVIGTDVVRFASFFVEPAAYATVIISALAHELFYYKKINGLFVSILCLGSLVSTSNTAIACVVLLLVFYFLKNGLLNRKFAILILLSCFLLIIAEPIINAVILRIEGGSSFSGRFDGYSYLSDLLSNPFWGSGFVSPKDMDAYLSGFPRLFLYMGIVGVFVYSLVFISIYKRSYKKILFFVFLFLNLGSDTLLGVGFLYYGCFIADSCHQNSMNGVPSR